MAKGKGQKVNRSELSGIFGVSLPTVDAWVRNGCPGVKSGSGRGGGWQFDSADVAAWLQQRAAAEAGGADTADEDAVKRQRARIALKSDELALAKQLGLVAPVHDFERAQAKIFAMLRQGVMTVPARVAMSLVGERSEIRIKQVLTAELTAALATVAELDFDLTEDDGDDVE